MRGRPAGCLTRNQSRHLSAAPFSFSPCSSSFSFVFFFFFFLCHPPLCTPTCGFYVHVRIQRDSRRIQARPFFLFCIRRERSSQQKNKGLVVLSDFPFQTKTSLIQGSKICGVEQSAWSLVRKKIHHFASYAFNFPSQTSD